MPGKKTPGTWIETRAWIRGLFDDFAELPHRGSGTAYEARAARLLARQARSSLAGRVDYQGFAVDISSGAWNVALHGAILATTLALLWLGGLGASAAWGPGRGAASLGPLGTVPAFSAFASLAITLLLLLSRGMAGRRGWGIFSFFVPNADSANLIVSTLDRAEDGESLRLEAAEAWKRRFAASGKKRLLILSAHYDSARCLPPLGPGGTLPKLLLAALKNGMGSVPTFSYTFLALTFAVSGTLGLVDASGSLMRGPLGWTLALGALLAYGLTCYETGMASGSADRPFQQGYNDNLSGVAAVLGAYRSLAPSGGEGLLRDTTLLVVLTGSEENGLRGSIEFATKVLEPAREVFGLDGVFLLNADSVSGGELIVSPGEHTFTGSVRGGDLVFARAAVDFLRGPRLRAPEVDEIFEKGEVESCLIPATDGAFGYKLRFEEEPLPACTDLTGFLSRPGFNEKLRAFTTVSRARNSGPLPQPRDYHQPSDTHATMFLASEPANFGTVVCVARAFADLAREIDRGGFD